MSRLTKIYGHRGSKGNYPENTLLSFQHAIDEGADGIELDVHLTKDDELVVIHDQTLDRTTNGKGEIKDLTLSEIRQYSAGSTFNHFSEYDNSWDKEKVPTLTEVLQLMADTDIELNIELKTYIYTYPGIEEKLLSVVKEFGGSRKIIYSSFHLPTLTRLKALDSEANIALLTKYPVTHPPDYMETFDLESFHIDKKLVLGGEYREYSKYMRVWTVNREEDMKKLMEYGVEAIITDFPKKAIALRVK